MDRKTLRALPKAELHRHLDGSVRLETIVDLSKHYNIDLGADSPDELRSKARITAPMQDLAAVLDTFWTTQKVLCSYEALRRVSFENVEDAHRDGVKLLELRFSPVFIAHEKELGNDEIIEGVLDGISQGMAEYPIQVGLIGIATRGFDLTKNKLALADLLHYKNSHHKNGDRICGFDLAGAEDETHFEDFTSLVNEAREAGVGITVHSGENTDARHVERSLDLYHPERIGHGIKIWGNEEVMNMVREREVLLEICLTSNWLTRSVPSLQEHPLPQLYKNRILVSINSDDPHLMDIDLVNEYELCVKHYNFSLDDFFEINELSVRRSFLDEEIKSYVLRDWRIQLPPIGRP